MAKKRYTPETIIRKLREADQRADAGRINFCFPAYSKTPLDWDLRGAQFSGCRAN